MNIAVYSGSFNPIHIGHKAIMEYLTNEANFDYVYLVVSPKNPLKDNICESSAQQRYEEAKRAIAKYPKLKVKVDDIELNMQAPYYTIKTLDALKTREPENDFTLIIGADNLSCIRQWKDYQRLLIDYGVMVYPRKDFNINILKKSLLQEYMDNPQPYVLDISIMAHTISLEERYRHIYKINLINAPLYNISSTEIRNMKENNIDFKKYLM